MRGFEDGKGPLEKGFSQKALQTSQARPVREETPPPPTRAFWEKGGKAPRFRVARNRGRLLTTARSNKPPSVPLLPSRFCPLLQPGPGGGAGYREAEAGGRSPPTPTVGRDTCFEARKGSRAPHTHTGASGCSPVPTAGARVRCWGPTDHSPQSVLDERGTGSIPKRGGRAEGHCRGWTYPARVQRPPQPPKGWRG